MDTDVKRTVFPKGIVSITAGAVLILSIFILVGMMYRSQTELLESAKLRLVQTVEKQANALNYFYSERRTDIGDLLIAWEIYTYFQNEALGMTLDYGLKASLNQVKKKFNAMITHRQIGNEPIYRWIAFLDENEKVLVMAESGKGDNIASCVRNLIGKIQGQTASITLSSCRGRTVTIVAAPYLFKNKYRGMICAAVNDNAAEQYLIRTGDHQLDNFFLISSQEKDRGKFSQLPEEIPIRILIDSEPNEISSVKLPGQKDQMVVIRSPVKDTPFNLVYVGFQKKLFDIYHSYRLMGTLLLLVLFVIGALVTLWRVNSRALILRTQLSSEKTSKQVMADKNRQLQTEIDMRIRVQESLKNNQERLDLALKASESGLWDWNIQSGAVLFNERWAEMLGYRPDEIENNVATWERLLHPDDKDMVMAALLDHLEGKTDLYQTEHRLLCKNQEWKWILDTGKVVSRSDDNRPLRAIGTHIDIHEKKEAEQFLKDYQQDLETEVTLRTRELEEAHKALLDRALEAGRAQLSAMVLHNIGNALTPISIYSEKLQEKDADEILRYLQQCHQDLSENKEHLTEYVADGQRGNEVLILMAELVEKLAESRKETIETLEQIIASVEYISEILTLQRSYAPETLEIKERVDLSLLVQDAVKMQEGAIFKRQIELHTTCAENLPRLQIEKSKLMQVIVNLIKNCCDAIDEAGLDRQHYIYISTLSRNGSVVFKIEDTGIGIEKERLEEIFEFGKSSKGSSGFGLYYCKSFIQSNHGTIFADSGGTGCGASFEIAFSRETTNLSEGAESPV